MRKLLLCLIIFFLFACNHIETGDGLSKSDIIRIQNLNLLDEGETIYKFYSEFEKQTAGNFFTDRRIATYWIDSNNKAKSEKSFAYYKDIRSIDTLYNAGATYSPYMLITKMDNSKFKLSVNGNKQDIRLFFEDAIKQWQLHK